jgi:hypothetical protein
MRFEFDDELLAHVQALLTAKLKRNEPFFMWWSLPREQGSGRVSLWMHPSVPVMFEFRRVARYQLEGQLLNELALGSASAFGLDMSEHTQRTGSGRPVPHLRDRAQ